MHFTSLISFWVHNSENTSLSYVLRIPPRQLTTPFVTSLELPETTFGLTAQQWKYITIIYAHNSTNTISYTIRHFSGILQRQIGHSFSRKTLTTGLQTQEFVSKSLLKQTFSYVHSELPSAWVLWEWINPFSFCMHYFNAMQEGTTWVHPVVYF